MNTCETCVHWGPNLGWRDMLMLPSYISIHDPATDEQKGRYERHNRESGICSKVDEGWNWDASSDALPIATVWDGSEYKASLHTHKSFGCVLHATADTDPAGDIKDRE